ncbi:MAG TPA: ABC transporter permease subunit [Candidatus Bathyarchaeia archaeon]|nr:ABC transporter permease subunit [Candidatus Bathyarchaeia archaeon]
MRKSRINKVIWSIASRELVDQLLSARFLIIMVLVVCLVPLAVYVGLQDYKNRLHDYDRLFSDKERLIAGEAGKSVSGQDNPWTPENELAVFRAVRRPNPLSVFIRGLDGAIPEYWDFTPTGIEEGPSALRPKRLSDLLGQLDMEFLIRVALGLLAILLAFDAVSGEKEMGTLRLAFSQPISRAGFLTGKLIAGAIALLVPVAASFLVALLSSKIFGMESLPVDGSLNLLLIFVASGICLLCFYSLGLLISSLTRSQKTSIIVLLVIWVVLTLAASPVATFTAQAVSPSPGRHLVETQKKTLDDSLRIESEKAMGSVYVEVTGVTDRMSYGDYLKNKGEVNRRIAPIIAAYVNKRRQLLAEVQWDADRKEHRQNRIARTIMWLSPAATYSNVATDLSGTGDESRSAWLEATQRYSNRLGAALFEDPPLITVQVGGMSQTIERRKLPTISNLPAFAAPAHDASATIQGALPSIMILLVYTVVFILAGFAAFIRYDVR